MSTEKSQLPPHRRLDEYGHMEYLCTVCGGPYVKFEQPVFTDDGETVHSRCLKEHQRRCKEKEK